MREDGLNNLQTIHYVNHSNEIFVRRVDLFNDKLIYRSLIIFVSFLFLVLIISLVGPKDVISDRIWVFTSPKFQKNTAKIRPGISKFNISLENITKNNKFMAVHVDINKISSSLDTPICGSSNSSTFIIATDTKKYISKKNISESVHSIGRKVLHYGRGMRQTDTLRLFRTAEINFDKLFISATISFEMQNKTKGLAVPCYEKQRIRVRAIYGNPAFDIYSDIFMFPVFIISVIMFVKLKNLHNRNDTLNTHTFRLVDVTCLSLSISSIPRFALNILFDVFTAEMFRVVVTEFLFSVMMFIGFSNLLFDIHKNVKSHICSYIPGFIIAAASLSCLVGTYFYNLKLIDKEEIILSDKTTTGMSIVLYAVSTIFMMSIVLVNASKKSHHSADKFVHYSMTICCVLVVNAIYLCIPEYTIVETCFGMNLYSLICSSLYCIFFCYLNWPIPNS